MKERVIIEGAAGRDYHNFLTFFKDNADYEVVAFTQAQIPGIEKRVFPKELAGKLYKKDIPMYPESEIASLIKKLKIDVVNLAYSDLSNEEVMHKTSIVNAAGADFMLLGPHQTQLKSSKPVISITAVRTGCGKSQVSRKIARILKARGLKVVAIRHPMPYGILKDEVVERFASYSDFKKCKCTIEELEEYEPWVNEGFIIYAGVDYKKILRQAEKEADVIIWDGGNNDFSFIKPDLSIVLVDPHRPNHEILYYPGEYNFRTADVIVINKVNTAKKENIAIVKENIRKFNPKAKVIETASNIILENPGLLRNKAVVAIEDGPTVTHGGMPYGAGLLAAKANHCKIISPVKYAVGSIRETFRKFPHLKDVLPAMGYSPQQIKELESTINKIPCDFVIDGSPADLSRILNVNKPIVNVTYDIQEKSSLTLSNILKKFVVA